MIKCLVNDIRHDALLGFFFFFFRSPCPCVVNDRSVFIRRNAVLSSVAVLIFAFGLGDLKMARARERIKAFTSPCRTWFDAISPPVLRILKRHQNKRAATRLPRLVVSCRCNAGLYCVPFAPLGRLRCSRVHHTIYSNLSLIKISAEL